MSWGNNWAAGEEPIVVVLGKTYRSGATAADMLKAIGFDLNRVCPPMMSPDGKYLGVSIVVGDYVEEAEKAINSNTKEQLAEYMAELSRMRMEADFCADLVGRLITMSQEEAFSASGDGWEMNAVAEIDGFKFKGVARPADALKAVKNVWRVTEEEKGTENDQQSQEPQDN